MKDRKKTIPIHLDVGWPWLLAGVMMLLAAGVIPSQLHLEEEQIAVQRLQAEYAREERLVETYERFLDEVSRGEETVVRRLAAAQLGLISADHKPLLLTSGLSEPPTRWIERTALSANRAGFATDATPTRSMLTQMLSGSGRLWVFAGALLSIFIGLLFSATTRGRNEGDSAALGRSVDQSTYAPL